MTWFDVLTVATVGLQFFNFWLVSKGKINYPLLIVIYVGYIILETTLALNQKDQIFILLFNLVNIWAIAMAIKGMLRQKNT